MNNQEIYEQIKEIIPNIEIKQNENMAKYTSFKIGGNADIFIKIKEIEQLKNILKYAKENEVQITIIGNGSNILIKDKGIRGITLKLDFNKIEIEEQKEKVFVFAEAGVKLGMLANMLQKRGISGFEFASRNSRDNRWSNSYECRSIWKRNAGNS